MSDEQDRCAQVGQTGESHIIEIRSEEERRQYERRVNDRSLESRVAALERAASTYQLSIARSEHHQRERRYQILQAAAVLVSSGRSRFLDWNVALQTATEMLTELERQDSAQ